MTTPLKLKALTGKSMTAGVNQIIYHGFPYRLMTDQYGIEGWSPFTTQYAPNVKFSSHINEANPFWSDIKEVNKFISRSQYAMRSGRPLADVLIYYPMVSSLIGPNPEEKLIGGYFDGVEPEAPKEYFVHNPDFKAEDSFFWEVANKLMERGITWDYVNEESLEGAEMHNGKINIRGNEYSAVILPNLNYSTYESARGINRLSKEGANVLIVGAIPSRQPGFYKYKERDKETYSLIKEAVHQKNGSQVVSAGYMDDWMDRLPQKISYKKNYDFLRQAVRELNDGGQLNYLWNMSGEWQNIEMVGNDKGLKYFYWLNPEDGRIIASENGKLSYNIPAYSSVILYSAREKIPERFLSKATLFKGTGEEVMQIKNWDITIGDTTIANSELFDWRDKGVFKYESGKGIYKARINLKKKDGKRYYLDLGKVYFTGRIWINGKEAANLIWSPYETEITSMLKDGDNEIKVEVTPTLLNKLVGLGRTAKEGDPYFPFRKDQDQLMSAGLGGPVVLSEF
jgi:hypothetical protein